MPTPSIKKPLPAVAAPIHADTVYFPDSVSEQCPILTLAILNRAEGFFRVHQQGSIGGLELQEAMENEVHRGESDKSSIRRKPPVGNAEKQVTSLDTEDIECYGLEDSVFKNNSRSPTIECTDACGADLSLSSDPSCIAPTSPPNSLLGLFSTTPPKVWDSNSHRRAIEDMSSECVTVKQSPNPELDDDSSTESDLPSLESILQDHKSKEALRLSSSRAHQLSSSSAAPEELEDSRDLLKTTTKCAAARRKGSKRGPVNSSQDIQSIESSSPEETLPKRRRTDFIARQSSPCLGRDKGIAQPTSEIKRASKSLS
ncbi:hypothetical protein FOXYSP1_19461 [Fusarium oxysporum f. sp. phaseoli]